MFPAHTSESSGLNHVHVDIYFNIEIKYIDLGVLKPANTTFCTPDTNEGVS